MCPSLLIVASMNTKLKATWKGKGLFGLCVLITVDRSWSEAEAGTQVCQELDIPCIKHFY